MFKRFFSGSVDDSNKGTPLLADDENQTTAAELTKILTLEEIQALPTGSFADRMRRIRQQAELANKAKTQVIVEKLIEPNLLFEARLRQETVAYLTRSIQEWNLRSSALCFHFDYYGKSSADRIHPLGRFLDRIIEYRNNHKAPHIILFNSLVADHLRAVLKLVMGEFSQTTGFHICDTNEKVPSTIHLQETKTEFIVTIRWA
jgi:hypothetical protein